MTTYSIVRYHKDHSKNYIIKTGLSLEEAQEHCSDPSTSGEDWFDGYKREEDSTRLVAHDYWRHNG